MPCAYNLTSKTAHCSQGNIPEEAIVLRPVFQWTISIGSLWVRLPEGVGTVALGIYGKSLLAGDASIASLSLAGR
jgi:hypothetical protein